MPHFYIPHRISGSSLIITDEERMHHIRDVLRLKPGEKVSLFDIEGNVFQAEIAEVSKERVVLSSLTAQVSEKNVGIDLTVACAIPKRSKLDEIIDKLTQLGVNTIIPLLTERTLVRADIHEESHLARWNRVALSASEQCQRDKLPVIIRVTTLQEVLANSAVYSLKLIATVHESAQPLRKVIEGLPAPIGKIIALIGPEGDFSPAEVANARTAGFIPVSLGRLVLRVETAAVALAAYLQLSLQY